MDHDEIVAAATQIINVKSQLDCISQLLSRLTEVSLAQLAADLTTDSVCACNDMCDLLRGIVRSGLEQSIAERQKTIQYIASRLTANPTTPTTP